MTESCFQNSELESILSHKRIILKQREDRKNLYVFAVLSIYMVFVKCGQNQTWKNVKKTKKVVDIRDFQWYHHQRC